MIQAAIRISLLCLRLGVGYMRMPVGVKDVLARRGWNVCMCWCRLGMFVKYNLTTPTTATPP